MLATAPGWFHLLEAPAHLTVASVRGIIDAVSAELDAGKRRVVLDLRGTEAIDDVALSAIVQLYKEAAAPGAKLLLRGPIGSAEPESRSLRHRLALHPVT